MSKSRFYLLYPFRKKCEYFLQYLGYFCQETGRSHYSKCCNQNLTNPISSTRFLVNFLSKNFGVNIFQFCGYRWQRTFQKDFNADFQVWLLFLVPRLYFWKKWVRFPDSEFNAESICTNLKSQKWKNKKLVCPFLIALFHHETNLIIFPLFWTILDNWEISSKSAWSRTLSFRLKNFFCLSTSFQGYLLFIYRQNLD